jgi:hypothetical protein
MLDCAMFRAENCVTMSEASLEGVEKEVMAAGSLPIAEVERKYN